MRPHQKGAGPGEGGGKGGGAGEWLDLLGKMIHLLAH
jgi:hypothetical protein